jgi:hypothetical protein
MYAFSRKEWYPHGPSTRMRTEEKEEEEKSSRRQAEQGLN